MFFGFGIVSFFPIIIVLILIYFFMDKTSTKDKVLILKNFYLYVVSFVALMMIVISSYSLIDIGLKTWVFTEADKYFNERPMTEVRYKYMGEGERVEMTEEEKTAENERMERQEEQNRKARLERDLTRNIAMLIVSIPLFSCHWYLVRKKERE